MKPRLSEKLSSTPGPGSYEVSKKKSAGYSIGSKLRDRSLDDVPGPG
jgi:hypothetical protein